MLIMGKADKAVVSAISILAHSIIWYIYHIYFIAHSIIYYMAQNIYPSVSFLQELVDVKFPQNINAMPSFYMA